MNQYPGYLTPDSLPVDDHCRTFRIPNDVQWLSVFMGALLPLIYPESWQQFGSLTPDESAEVMLNVIWDAYTDDIGICPVVPTPYWDTVTDIDDQDPEGAAQTWYGQIVSTPALLADDLTFVENAFIWTVAGFIALSGLPGAAIAFVPVAKRFVLAFKQHDLGGIVKVLIDFAEVAEIDTYGVGETIQNLNIFMPDDDESHTLYVMMADESNPAAGDSPYIQVVRKELAPGQVYPANLRYNSSTDQVQTTFDDGSTWVDTPGQDPRHSTSFEMPSVGGDDPRCQAAANMTRYFEDLVGEALSAISSGLDALAVATTLLPLLVELGPFAILFDLAIALASALISLGADVINAEFTPETYDALQCIFDCAIESDGSVTSDDLATISSKIESDLNPDVFLIMSACFFLMGEVGLSNAGATGAAPADCSGCDCGWCLEFDFKTGLHGWTIVTAPGLTEGHQVAGVGIVAEVQNDACSGHGYIQLYIDLGATIDNIDTVEIFQTCPNFDSGGAYYVDQDNGATIVRRVTWGSFSGPGQVNVFINDGTMYNRINVVDFQCGQDPGNPQTIEKIRFVGFGDPPSVGDVCP